jgi:hypothetical protein
VFRYLATMARSFFNRAEGFRNPFLGLTHLLNRAATYEAAQIVFLNIGEVDVGTFDKPALVVRFAHQTPASVVE